MSDDSDRSTRNWDETDAGNAHSDAEVEDNTIREEREVVVSRRVESAPRQRNTSEYIHFFVLAVILLGTPLVIALLNPLIFGTIVPAVMGSGTTTPPPAVEGYPAAQPEQIPLVPEDQQAGYPAPTEQPPEVAPSPSPTTLLYHIVQPGENLTRIANQYGVTVDALAAANNLTNASQILSGTVLIIPPSGDNN
jgi:LysM repeat protein